MEILFQGDVKGRNIALIPTGEVFRLDKEQTLDQTMKNFETFAKNNHLNIYAPQDKNLFDVEYSFSRSHTPTQKAIMLLDALKNPAITDIYLTGGNGTEDVVAELDKIITPTDRQMIKSKKVYGMSDATHLLNYLGQQQLAFPHILIGDWRSITTPNTKYIKEFGGNEIQDFYSKNPQEKIEGVIIPGDLVHGYGKKEQLKLAKDKMNFIAEEIRFPNEGDRIIKMLEGLAPADKKNICFLFPISLQNDKIKEQETSKLKDWCKKNDVPYMQGLKFGHNVGQVVGNTIIPTFTNATLENGKLTLGQQLYRGGFKDVNLNAPKLKMKEKTDTIQLHNANGGTANFNNYNIDNSKDTLRIKVDNMDIQSVEVALKDLATHNIISKDSKIKQIFIEPNGRIDISVSDKLQKQMQDTFQYIANEYLPNQSLIFKDRMENTMEFKNQKRNVFSKEEIDKILEKAGIILNKGITIRNESKKIISKLDNLINKSKNNNIKEM
ncbi:MAG: hypothetical protein Ta2D_05110 [Rickettsiales bacterium]|nr:MAG: hypothetical protein Ta2D_05110 [Rickettsiales bacterium]